MPKVKFRFHRGGFDESMATMIEDEPDVIRKKIAEVQPGVITSKFVCTDERSDWGESYIVLVDGFPAGYTNNSIFPESCPNCEEPNYRIGGFCSRGCEKQYGPDCAVCMTKEDVSLTTDALSSEIYGDDRKRWLCGRCTAELADEV